MGLGACVDGVGVSGFGERSLKLFAEPATREGDGYSIGSDLWSLDRVWLDPVER